MKESFTLDLKRPPKEAFEALTDLERIAAMSGGKLVVEKVADRPRVGKGSAVTLKVAAGGPGMGDILCETTAWEPPSLCVRRFAVKDLPTTATMRFEPIDGGTRVTVDLELEPKSLMYKMMLPALAMKVRADKDKLIAQLRQELGPPA